jgi:two-component system CheB/CheR fusion protein
MPADSGMAFVVVTHQPPHRTSLLPDILGKSTRMRVIEAATGMPVEPNVVYIAPPDGHLSIRHATLQQLEATAAENARLPIDAFFRALAADQQEKAIGVVLSGTGTDGTLGLQVIKGASGMVMVQEPQSARYDGMPRSAIATGLVDYVLPPSAMPERLLAYAQGPYVHPSTADAIPLVPEVIERIFLLLRARVGHDFSGYKPNTLQRRISRRMNVHQITDPQQYLRFLQEHPHELELLFKEMLISVTSFFRDPEAFESLATTVLPLLLASKANQDTVRIWVPGCATGEEAYSLGMLFQEGLEHVGKHCKVQIFATDLDGQAIETARRGVYPEGIAVDVSGERLGRFFTKEDSRYRINKEIRDMVIFALHNLLSDPPFTKLDFLSCRNVLIYLDTALQKRLLPTFHYALQPGGVLFLGPSETISGFEELFTTIDNRWKLFRYQEATTGSPFPVSLASRVETRKSGEPRLAERTQQDPLVRQELLINRLLAARYAPPSIIINNRGDIIHFHGRTGTFLEPAPGQPRLNVLDMAREGLRLSLINGIRQAMGQGDEVILEPVRVQTNGGHTLVRVMVGQISEPELLRGLLRVSFEPMAEAAATRRRGRGRKQTPQNYEGEQELRLLREELQRTREELDASYEEFQSTNEEMQSTNEELESAKEELQSLNEELQTVNAELQGKIDSLTETNDDMANLLNSTDIATIFLDSNLYVKRFTPQARDVFHLIPSDIGRPLSDIASALTYDRLVPEAQEILRTLGAKDQEVRTAAGDWYLMRIRPYRTARNVIDGVVLTFIDITRLKQAEEAQQVAEEARQYAENIVQTVREPLVILDAELRVVSANQRFYHYFQVTPEETEHQYLYELGNRHWDVPALRQRLVDTLQHEEAFEDFEIICDVPHLGQRLLRLNARRIQQQSGQAGLILLAIEDATPPG